MQRFSKSLAFLNKNKNENKNNKCIPFLRNLVMSGTIFMLEWVVVCLILQCNNTWFTRVKIKLLW